MDSWNENRVAKGAIVKKKKKKKLFVMLHRHFGFLFSFILSPIFGVLFCLLFRADAD